jgi:glutamate/aspartate transport system permease protein
MFALQAGEETSRNIEIFLATTTLYFVSAYTVSHLSLYIEKRLRLPGSIINTTENLTGGVK